MTAGHILKRTLKYGLLLILVLIVILIATLAWALGSQSGLRFALSQAENITDHALTVGNAQGSLLRHMQLDDVRYVDKDSGIDASVSTLVLSLAPKDLLHAKVHVKALHIDNPTVHLSSTDKAPEPETEKESSGQFSFKAPIDIQIDAFTVKSLALTQDGDEVFVANKFELKHALWDKQKLKLGQLALDSPDGKVDIHGEFGFAEGYQGQAHGRFNWQAGEYAIDGKLDAHSDGDQTIAHIVLAKPLETKLEATITQQSDLPWKLDLAIPKSDITAFIDNDALREAGVDIHAEGGLDHAHVKADIALQDYTLKLAPLDIGFDADKKRITFEKLKLESPDAKGSINLMGVVNLGADPIDGKLDAVFDQVELPEALLGYQLVANGKLAVDGNQDDFKATVALDAGLADRPSHLDATIAGSSTKIYLDNLAIMQKHGFMKANGQVDLDPAIAWDIHLDGDNFKPEDVWPGFASVINVALDTRGKLDKKGPEIEAHIAKLDALLNGKKIAGQGKIHVTPDMIVNGKLDITSGHSTLAINAQGDTRNDIHTTLDVASLGDFLPSAKGQVKSKLHITGAWPQLAIKGNINAHNLAFTQNQLKALALDLNVPDITSPAGTIRLDANQLDASGVAYQSISLKGDGNQAKHQLKLSANGEPASIDLALSGGMQDDNWLGQLTQLSITPAMDIPAWQLQKPARLAWQDQRASLDDMCLGADQSQLCLNLKQDKQGNTRLQYDLSHLPLAMLLQASGDDLPMQAEGEISGQGDITYRSDGNLVGEATIGSQHGDIRYVDLPDEDLLSYRDFTVRAKLDANSKHITIASKLNEGGNLDGDISIQGANDALSGNIHLYLDSLRAVELFTDQIADIKGNLKGDFTLQGSLASPAIFGEANIRQLGMEVPMAGLKLHDGNIRIASEQQNDHLELDGTVQSGDGNLDIGGQLALGDVANSVITIKGEQFQAADIPGADVAISPDLKIMKTNKGTSLTGQLKFDKAHINLEKLPGGGGGGGGIAADPDVVVVDEDKVEEQETGLPFNMDINIDLGDQTDLKGYGLDGRLNGSLDIRQRPKRQTLGRGQVTINGTYKAYGQDLHVKDGRLLFASTPVDNPGLNIRATRNLDPNATIDEHQEVGLHITGTARRPSMVVFSNPSMEQSDALAYLVTGKPLSAAGGGEGDAVNAAAQALGSMTGDMLAKGIGSRLGIEAGVGSSSALGTTAFTVGKYLSPKLYMSYGVGVFDPGQVVTLRYILSRRWNFEAEQATEFSRASFNYRIEK